MAPGCHTREARSRQRYVTVPPRLAAGSPRAARVQDPAGPATLGTIVDEDDVRMGQRAARRYSVEVPAFAIDAHNVTNAEFMAFVDAGGYGDPRWWRAEDWAWVAGASTSRTRLLEARGGGWRWRGDVRAGAVAAGVAGLRHVGRSPRLRAVAWRAVCRPKRSFIGRRSGPRRRERAYPWGETLDRAGPGNFDFERWDPEPVGAVPTGTSAFGVHDLVGQRMGMDVGLSSPRSTASRRCRHIRSTRLTFSTVRISCSRARRR